MLQNLQNKLPPQTVVRRLRRFLKQQVRRGRCRGKKPLEMELLHLPSSPPRHGVRCTLAVRALTPITTFLPSSFVVRHMFGILDPYHDIKP